MASLVDLEEGGRVEVVVGFDDEYVMFIALDNIDVMEQCLDETPLNELYVKEMIKVTPSSVELVDPILVSYDLSPTSST